MVIFSYTEQIHTITSRIIQEDERTVWKSIKKNCILRFRIRFMGIDRFGNKLVLAAMSFAVL